MDQTVTEKTEAEVKSNRLADNYMLSMQIEKKEEALALVKMGFALVERTEEEQMALGLLSEAITPDKDVYRFERATGKGTPIADSGNMIWTKEGRYLIWPELLVEDLAELGYTIVVAEVFTRKNSGKYRFRITFAKTETPPMQLSDEKLAKIIKIVRKLYYRGWAYFNAQTVSLTPETDPVKGSLVTFNLVSPQRELYLTRNDPQSNLLRVFPNGSIRTIPKWKKASKPN